MKSACLRDYWDLIHNFTQSWVHQEMMCRASSLCLACKTCSVIQRQKGANNLWSNLMLICRWWSKLCQQIKGKLRCGRAGSARWWVLQPEPGGQLVLTTEELTWLVVFLFWGGKLRQRSEAAWLVATCPGIIPFCSTAGLPFLSLFFLQKEVAETNDMQRSFPHVKDDDFFYVRQATVAHALQIFCESFRSGQMTSRFLQSEV